MTINLGVIRDYLVAEVDRNAELFDNSLTEEVSEVAQSALQDVGEIVRSHGHKVGTMSANAFSHKKVVIFDIRKAFDTPDGNDRLDNIFTLFRKYRLLINPFVQLSCASNAQRSLLLAGLNDRVFHYVFIRIVSFADAPQTAQLFSALTQPFEDRAGNILDELTRRPYEIRDYDEYIKVETAKVTILKQLLINLRQISWEEKSGILPNLALSILGSCPGACVDLYHFKLFEELLAQLPKDLVDQFIVGISEILKTKDGWAEIFVPDIFGFEFLQMLFENLDTAKKPIFAANVLRGALSYDKSGTTPAHNIFKSSLCIAELREFVESLNETDKNEILQKFAQSLAPARSYSKPLLNVALSCEEGANLVQFVYDQLPDEEKRAFRTSATKFIVNDKATDPCHLLLIAMTNQGARVFVETVIGGLDNAEKVAFFNNFLQKMVVVSKKHKDNFLLNAMSGEQGQIFFYNLTGMLPNDPIPFLRQLSAALLQKVGEKLPAPFFSAISSEKGIQLLDRILCVVPEKDALVQSIITTVTNPEEQTFVLHNVFQTPNGTQFLRRVVDLLSEDSKNVFAKALIKRFGEDFRHRTQHAFEWALGTDDGTRLVRAMFQRASQEGKDSLVEKFFKRVRSVVNHVYVYRKALSSRSGAIFFAELLCVYDQMDIVWNKIFPEFGQALCPNHASKGYYYIAFFSKILELKANDEKVTNRLIKQLTNMESIETFQSSEMVPIGEESHLTASHLYIALLSGEEGRAFVKTVFESCQEDVRAILVQNLATCIQINVRGEFSIVRGSFQDYTTAIPSKQLGVFQESVESALLTSDAIIFISQNLRERLPFLTSLFEIMQEEKRDNCIQTVVRYLIPNADLSFSLVKDTSSQLLLYSIMQMASKKFREAYFISFASMMRSLDDGHFLPLILHPHFLTVTLAYLPIAERKVLLSHIAARTISSTFFREALLQALCENIELANFLRKFFNETFPEKGALIAALTKALQGNEQLLGKILKLEVATQIISLITKADEGKALQFSIAVQLANNAEAFACAVQDKNLAVLCSIPEALDHLRDKVVNELKTSDYFLQHFLSKSMLISMAAETLNSLQGEERATFANRVACMMFLEFDGVMPLYYVLADERGVNLVNAIRAMYSGLALNFRGRRYNSFDALLAQILVMRSHFKPLNTAILSEKGRELVESLKPHMSDFTDVVGNALLAQIGDSVNLTRLMRNAKGAQFVEAFLKSIPVDCSNDLKVLFLRLIVFPYNPATTLFSVCKSLRSDQAWSELLAFAIDREEIPAVTALKAAGINLPTMNMREADVSASIRHEKLADIETSSGYDLDTQHLSAAWFEKYTELFPAPNVNLADEIWKLKYMHPGQSVAGVERILHCIEGNVAIVGVPSQEETRKKFYRQLECLLKHIFNNLKRKMEFAPTVLVQLDEAGSHCGERWFGEALLIYQPLLDTSFTDLDLVGKLKFYILLLNMREEIISDIVLKQMQKRRIPESMQVHYFDAYLRLLYPMFGIPNYFVAADQLLDLKISDYEMTEIRSEFYSRYNSMIVMIHARDWMKQNRDNVDFVKNSYPKDTALGDILTEETGLPKSQAMAFWLTKQLGVLKERGASDSR